MSRQFKLTIALAALFFAGWLAVYVLINSRNLPPAVEAVVEKLPGRTAAAPSRIDYQSLDRQLAELAQRPEMAGLAVAVVEDGEIRFVRTYGVADRSTGLPVTKDTMFRWASVSKTATGMLAAKLAEEGALDLRRPLTSWQTTLRLPQGGDARVTLEQLLAQQTGLTKHAYDEKLEDEQSPTALRLSLAGAPLQCQPGTCHTYQNVAFDAASEILGEAAGKPFEAAVVERLFAPLGMASARYGMAGLTGAADWARPHKNDKVRPLREAYWRVPAAAGVESNIGDFARWMQAAMGQQPDILPPSAIARALAPRVATQKLYSGKLARVLTEPGYGLGWRSFTYAGRRLVGHSGAVDGYRATMIFDPKARTGVVAMWNSNWGVPFRLPFAALDSYYRLPDCGWLDVRDIPLPGAEPPLPAAQPKKEEGPPCPTR